MCVLLIVCGCEWLFFVYGWIFLFVDGCLKEFDFGYVVLLIEVEFEFVVIVVVFG